MSDNSYGPYETLLVTVEDGIATIVLNRPKAGNSINQKLDSELGGLWPRLRDDDAVDVVVLSAAGERFFCTGADVKEWAATQSQPMANVAEGHGFQLLSRDQEFYKPIICAVNGVCAGGGFHFVSDSDIVISSTTATYLDPHVTVGQVTAHEPIWLSRRIPLGEVLRLALMGVHGTMTAERAYQLGLVSELVEPAQLMERAHEIAKLVQTNSPAAVQKSKRATIQSLDRGIEDALWWGFGIVRSHWGHPDSTEGPKAFQEKRTPQWTRGKVEQKEDRSS